jgi:hypothetical protein
MYSSLLMPMLAVPFYYLASYVSLRRSLGALVSLLPNPSALEPSAVAITGRKKFLLFPRLPGRRQKICRSNNFLAWRFPLA